MTSISMAKSQRNRRVAFVMVAVLLDPSLFYRLIHIRKMKGNDTDMIIGTFPLVFTEIVEKTEDVSGGEELTWRRPRKWLASPAAHPREKWYVSRKGAALCECDRQWVGRKT